jgi:hypothetical protein
VILAKVLSCWRLKDNTEMITEQTSNVEHPMPRKTPCRSCISGGGVGTRAAWIQTHTARVSARRRIHRSAPLERAAAIRIFLPETVGLRTHSYKCSVPPRLLVKRSYRLVRERAGGLSSELPVSAAWTVAACGQIVSVGQSCWPGCGPRRWKARTAGCRELSGWSQACRALQLRGGCGFSSWLGWYPRGWSCG